jgi:hypothetical protein
VPVRRGWDPVGTQDRDRSAHRNRAGTRR